MSAVDSVIAAGLAKADAARKYAPLSGLDGKGPGQNTRVLRQFRSQLARRESAAVDVVLMGHSLIEGEGATSMLKRGNDRFRDIMRTRFPVAGVTGGYGYMPIRVASTTWSLSPYITTSGGTASSAYGFGIGSYFVNSAAAKVVLSSIACSAVDVIYVQGGGGTFTTKVDGVANGDSVVTTGAPTQQKAYRVPGITAGSHSVEVGFVSGNSIICGFMIYNGDTTAGLRTWVDARGGVTSASILDSAGVHFSGLNVAAPSLVVLSALANDFKTGVPLATSRANLVTILAQIRAKAPAASIVFAIEHALGNTGATIPWASYAQLYYDVAAEDGNVAVFDFYQRVGTSTPPTLPGIIYTDNQHYTDAGYLMWAEALAAFVSP